MLQVIRHLLTRPEYFRLERELAGLGFHQGGQCALQGTHSNTVERSMRPIAMGRRNSLFSGSEGGAESWAVLASIVNTAKLHDLDPQAYLTDILERIVSGHTRNNQLHELLAWNWKAARACPASIAA